MRAVSMVLDMAKLQVQLQRMLIDSQTPHEVLLSTCLDDHMRSAS